jgi:hypothetical protein
MRKIISLVLVAAIFILSVTSCTPSPDKLLNKAESANSNLPHTVEVEIDYTCNDSTVAGIFEQLENSKTKVYYKDGNVIAENELSISVGNDNYSFKYIYTLVGEVLYVNNSYTDGKNPAVTQKSKALISADQKQALLDELTVVGGISASDFSEISVSKSLGEATVICSGVSEEKQIAIEKALISQLESTLGSVKATSVEMKIELDGGKYDSVTIVCEYDITLNDKLYSIGMEVELDYDYDEYFRIIIPENPEEYTSVDIDTLL